MRKDGQLTPGERLLLAGDTAALRAAAVLGVLSDVLQLESLAVIRIAEDGALGIAAAMVMETVVALFLG